MATSLTLAGLENLHTALVLLLLELSGLLPGRLRFSFIVESSWLSQGVSDLIIAAYAFLAPGEFFQDVNLVFFFLESFLGPR